MRFGQGARLLQGGGAATQHHIRARPLQRRHRSRRKTGGAFHVVVLLGRILGTLTVVAALNSATHRCGGQALLKQNHALRDDLEGREAELHMAAEQLSRYQEEVARMSALIEHFEGKANDVARIVAEAEHQRQAFAKMRVRCSARSSPSRAAASHSRADPFPPDSYPLSLHGSCVLP